MSTELVATRSQTRVSPSQERAAVAPAKRQSFDEIVAQVIGDSQHKPGEYLDEVVVLKGGE